jgi:hypothetical protein
MGIWMKRRRQLKRLMMQSLMLMNWGRIFALRHWFTLKKWPGPNPYSLQVINPADVKVIQAGHANQKLFNSRGRFDPTRPRILDGEWDRQVIQIEDTCLYKGLKQHFQDGVSWEKTCLCSGEYTAEDQNVPLKYARFDMAEFSKRAKYLDELYKSLSKGYRNYRERRDWFWNEVTINIGRDAELIYNSSGLHRLVLGQLLHLEAVQARVLVVHTNFIKEFRRDARSLGPPGRGRTT